MAKNWQKIRMLVLTMLILSIAGCGYSKAAKKIYSSECCSLKMQYYWTKQLDYKGIQTVKTGDEITLILPTEKIFYADSNNLSQTQDLNTIVKFLNAYPVADIQVRGYTNSQGNYKRNRALSTAQAQAIANYLWKYGLNSRLISAAGYGCHNIYGFNHLEIFFRLPPPENVFH